MNSSFGCIIKTAAIYAFFFNRLVERHNGMLKNIMKSRKKDHNLLESLYKNCLHMPSRQIKMTPMDVNGVSPLQRLYGLTSATNILNQKKLQTVATLKINFTTLNCVATLN